MKIFIENSFCIIEGLSSDVQIDLEYELSYIDSQLDYVYQRNLKRKKELQGRIDSPRYPAAAKQEARQELKRLHHILIANEEKRWVSLLEGNKFPTGLLPDVEAYFKLNNITYSKEDKRVKPTLLKHKFRTKISFFPARYYQKEIIKLAVEKARGVIVSPTGCHAKGTEVLMFDGSFKKVEDVVVGDKLMGPDSSPRNVEYLCRGRERMVKITPNKGEPFIVNENHILSLKRTNDGTSKAGTIENISVKDYLNKSKTYKHIMKLYRVPIDFTVSSKEELIIPPYILGLWLGDGSAREAAITSMDEEVIQSWINWGKTLNCNCLVRSKLNNKASTYALSSNVGKKYKNPANDLFRKENLLKNKHIPCKYKINSREVRLELLAGILDSDGFYDGGIYDFISKYKHISEDVAFIARSLGLYAKVTKCEKSAHKNHRDWYYRVCISGDLEKIPTKVSRRKANTRKQVKDVLVTGFSIEMLPEDEYYGFNLNKDHLYLLKDFTVTHNTGKSFLINKIIWELGLKTIIICPGKEIANMLYDDLMDYYGKGVVALLNSKSEKSKLINIVNIQAIDSMPKKLFKDIEVMFIDEFHHGAAATYRKANEEYFNHIYYRFGLTATFFRNNGDDLALKGVLSDVIYEYKLEDAFKDGFLMKPEFIWIQNQGISESSYIKEYKSCIVDNESRNKDVVDICKEHENDSVMILVQQVRHGKMLEEMIEGSKFIHGKEKQDVRKKAMEDFRNGDLKFLIGINTILGEGVNLPRANVLIMAGGGKSKGSVMQNIGRVLRLHEGKTEALVYDFEDAGTNYMERHSIAREEVYKLYTTGEHSQVDESDD